MPAILPRIAEHLDKRYTSCNAYGYCTRSTHPWYLFFLLFIPLFLLLLCCCRRRNMSRRNQGMPPVPYTGWTTYQFNGNQQQQTYQEPYYEAKPEETGYNNNGTAPPAYGNDNTQYQRPMGAPPGTNAETYNSGNVPSDYQSPQAPSNAYYRS